MLDTLKRALALGLVIGLLGSAACGKDPPPSTRWDQAASAAKASADKPAATPSAPPAEKKESGSFNKFFPAEDVDGHKRVYTSDKDGYAEAKLTKDGKDVAQLAITDVNGKEADAKKFEGSKEDLSGFPVATFGKNKTMVLVKGRYQVSVSSQTLDHEARKRWIGKFDLKGLSAL